MQITYDTHELFPAAAAATTMSWCPQTPVSGNRLDGSHALAARCAR